MTARDSIAVLIQRPDGMSTVAAAAVFDCRGFTGVRETANPVVSDVVSSGVAVPNRCGRGLRVDERFQAAQGLFVLGPALGGTSQGVYIFSPFDGSLLAFNNTADADDVQRLLASALDKFDPPADALLEHPPESIRPSA